MLDRPDQLTPHERAVVLALLSGSSNRELADQLFVSVKTIETHLTRIFRKVGCRSRGQLIAAYYEDRIPDLSGGVRPLAGSPPR